MTTTLNSNQPIKNGPIIPLASERFTFEPAMQLPTRIYCFCQLVTALVRIGFWLNHTTAFVELWLLSQPCHCLHRNLFLSQPCYCLCTDLVLSQLCHFLYRNFVFFLANHTTICAEICFRTNYATAYLEMWLWDSCITASIKHPITSLVFWSNVHPLVPYSLTQISVACVKNHIQILWGQDLRYSSSKTVEQIVIKVTKLLILSQISENNWNHTYLK